MKISTKKNNLSRVALLATLITVTNGYIGAAENEASVQDLGTFVVIVERNLADFFDQANKTSFTTFITALETIFADFKRKTEEAITRNNNADALTKEINDLVDYTIYKFGIVYSIMKKYCGRPASEALIFGTEIERDFNPEKVFTEIVTKFKALKSKAKKAGDPCLEKKLDSVIKVVEILGKKWNAKSRSVLLLGISHRMQCK